MNYLDAAAGFKRRLCDEREDQMPVYKAPVDDTLFLLNDVFNIERYNNLPGFADAVSYTHLDVYKRQPKGTLSAAGEAP